MLNLTSIIIKEEGKTFLPSASGGLVLYPLESEMLLDLHPHRSRRQGPRRMLLNDITLHVAEVLKFLCFKP